MQEHTDPIHEKKGKIWKMRGRIELDKSSERLKNSFQGVMLFSMQWCIWQREARTITCEFFNLKKKCMYMVRPKENVWSLTSLSAPFPWYMVFHWHWGSQFQLYWLAMVPWWSSCLWLQVCARPYLTYFTCILEIWTQIHTFAQQPSLYASLPECGLNCSYF